MNYESLIKSKIASEIVSFLLQENGYLVIPYGKNDIAEYLIRIRVAKNRYITELLFNSPHFVVVDKKKEPFLVQVKFKGREKSGRSIEWGYKKIKEYWPNTHMVVVTNEDPFFFLSKENYIIPLTESVFKINKKTSEKYARLVKKILLK